MKRFLTSPKFILSIVLIVAIILVVVYVYRHQTKNYNSVTGGVPTGSGISNYGGSGGGGGGGSIGVSAMGEVGGSNAEFLYFYTDWCPYCKKAKPIWESLVTEYTNKNINGYTITFTPVNCTTENADAVQKINTYNVDGYPTFIIDKGNNNICTFDSRVNLESLEQFINSCLNS